MMGDSFIEYVRDQLGDLPNLTFRRMFGGYGIYQGQAFFGILFKGRLYFKTDARTCAGYLARGMDVFRPSARQALISYYEVPADVLEDTAALAEWAQHAVTAARTKRTRATKSRSRKRIGAR